MFSDSDETLDLSRQSCWQGSKDASKPCTPHKPLPDDLTHESFSEWPLCRVKPGASEAYRLVVRPSFSGKEVYYVGINNEIGDLWWQTCEGLFLPNKPRLRPGLSKSFFAPLFAALESVQFWNATSTPDHRIGLNGHCSTFEGICGDRYRRLTRWSPKGPLGDLERAFTGLAGVKPSWC